MNLTLQTVLAITGSIALLVGLFGGGIKAKEIVVPTLPTLPRILLSVIGMALIATAIALPPQNSLSQPEPTGAAPIQVSDFSQPPEPTSVVDTYVNTPRVGVATSSCSDP